MTRNRILILAAMALGAILWTNACDGGTEPPPPDPPRPTTVSITPATAELAALEATVQFTAEVRDQNGNVMANAAVSWSSSDAAVAVAPAADTLVEADTLRFSAEAADANGHTVQAMDFMWSSGDTLVAVVDDSGLVTGIAPTELRQLNLCCNRLVGPLPPELANLAKLEGLDLQGISMGGPIPHWFGELTSLRSLSIHGSGLTGVIPPEIGKLSNLWDLSLDHTASRAIPTPAPNAWRR